MNSLCPHPDAALRLRMEIKPAEGDLPERLAWRHDCGECDETLAHGWDVIA